jgi:hypothetical protein
MYLGVVDIFAMLVEFLPLFRVRPASEGLSGPHKRSFSAYLARRLRISRNRRNFSLYFGIEALNRFSGRRIRKGPDPKV